MKDSREQSRKESMLRTLSSVITLAAMLAGILAFTPPDALAQARKNLPIAQRPNAQRPNRAAGQLSPAEVVGMLDAYAVVQAQEALQLNDGQYGQFVARLKKLQETRRSNQQARNQIVQDLRQLTGPQTAPQVDEPAVRERLKTLRDHDDRAAAEMRRAYDVLDEGLDVRQQARFRIFEEQIERRKLDLLMRARQGAARNNRDR